MKGGQQVGPSVGPIARLKQENRDLKGALAAAHDAIRISNVVVEDLQDQVAWLETPMRARHKALLAAADELSTDDFHELWGKAKEGSYDKSLWSSFLFKIERIQTAIADCKGDGPK